jgi:hypothetical protein
MPKGWHWTEAFVDKLKGTVKLVGTSLVCLDKSDPSKHIGPRVEGFAFALDLEGLKIALETGSVFKQHASKHDAIVEGEYGLSAAILKRGFSLDTFLLAYQGVDWRDKKYWDCNKNQHPSQGEKAYFGISLNPLEVMFHKSHWTLMGKPVLVMYSYAQKYKEWGKSEKITKT